MKYLFVLSMLLLSGCSSEQLPPAISKLISASSEEVRDLNERYYKQGCLDMLRAVEKADGGFFRNPTQIISWCGFRSKLAKLPEEEGCEK